MQIIDLWLGLLRGISWSFIMKHDQIAEEF